MDDRFAALRNATVRAVLRGTGATDPELRQAVADGRAPEHLVSLVEKIRARAYTVDDPDIDALRSRHTDDQLFEIIVAAALGAARDRLAAAHRALEDA